MDAQNNKYTHPAVPPLYPMDPCRQMPYGPMPYEPMPYDMPYEPMPYDMPYEPYGPIMPITCPIMDPRFRDCIRVCMMQCGYHPMYPDHPMEMPYDDYNGYTGAL